MRLERSTIFLGVQDNQGAKFVGQEYYVPLINFEHRRLLSRFGQEQSGGGRLFAGSREHLDALVKPTEVGVSTSQFHDLSSSSYCKQQHER